jgi:hypothetical protein
MLSAAAITTLALAPVLGLASPASAAVIDRECASNLDKPLFTPGDDVFLDVSVCVQKDSTGVFRAQADFEWQHGGYKVDFDKLELHLRLERYDVVVKGARCDFRTRVENETWGSALCQVPWTSAAPPLTADATVVYNHNNDGKGDYKMELTGSPSI